MVQLHALVMEWMTTTQLKKSGLLMFLTPDFILLLYRQLLLLNRFILEHCRTPTATQYTFPTLPSIVISQSSMAALVVNTIQVHYLSIKWATLPHLPSLMLPTMPTQEIFIIVFSLCRILWIHSKCMLSTQLSKKMRTTMPKLRQLGTQDLYDTTSQAILLPYLPWISLSYLADL